MNKKTTALAITVILLTGTTAAFMFGNEEPETSELDKVKDTSDVELGQSWLWEAKLTEKNQRELSKKYPPMTLEDSLERQNLRKRYKHLNDRDVVHHVYLLSHGKVVAYHTAQGKVSSVNSKLTQPQQFVPCSAGGDQDTYRSKDRDCVVDSPQMDGSYGTNGAAIFFFTTDGKYVEWNGEYLVSDQPMNIQTPLTLTKQVE